MRKIVDCITYFNEDMLLDFRLNVLNDYVDYFVIVEAREDHQGNKKELNFKYENFKKFKDKIIYVVQDKIMEDSKTHLPKNWSKHHLKDQSQRNYILNGLNNFNDDDLIIISDLDEIPNPKVINNFKENMRYAVFKQKHFYYKFNLQSQKNPAWFGSRICLKKYLKSPQWLRNLKFKKRSFWRIDKFRLNNILEDGGWHFCNIKTEDKLLNKYKNLCETYDPIHFKEKINEKFLNLEEIKKRVKGGDDIIGRNDKFLKINIDQSYPKYFLDNLSKYKSWIE